MKDQCKSLDVLKIRKDFPILSRKVNGKPLIYFDNAATSQTPQQVIDVIVNYYSEFNANIHRGVHQLSQEATDKYEQARMIIQKHFNARTPKEIIFTSGTTHSINIVANGFTEILKKGDVILVSAMEHHSNIVPWQMLCDKTSAILKVIPMTEEGELNMNEFYSLLKLKPKLVFVNHISNALGTINPIKQIIDESHKVDASLIPFLEHDDANRALMGSNMMRQAVPLLRPEAPIVGTGLERQVASDSRVLVNAEADGVVKYVDAEKIIIKYNRSSDEELVSFDSDTATYPLTKFRKTNQGTSVNLKTIVNSGDKVSKGQVLCEGYATQNGELALGRNMKVAFMPWKGYNFEDAIVISEKVVRDDIFTSIHIDEYSLEVRDTKLGNEELTNDIPNVSEEATKDLDENGMIRIGAEIKPGDILIGKITPK